MVCLKKYFCLLITDLNLYLYPDFIKAAVCLFLKVLYKYNLFELKVIFQILTEELHRKKS